MRRDPSLVAGGALSRFYGARDYAPLWIADGRPKPEAYTLIAMTDALPSGAIGAEDASALRQMEAEAASGDPERLARLESALSRTLLAVGQTLHAPFSRQTTFYVAPFRPRGWNDGAQMLTSAADAPSLRNWLSSLTRANPLQLAYLRGLRDYRQRWSRLPQTRIDPGPALAAGASGERVAQLARRLGLNPAPGEEARFDETLGEKLRSFQRDHGLVVTGIADPATLAALNRGAAHYEGIIRANLDRAGALPIDLGRRYVLVNSATQELYAVENGRLRDRMRVIIGKAETPTPDMVAPLRFMIVNPYWNVPPDLAAKRAARVVREGHDVIAKERLQLLSGWDGDVRVLQPDEVDWPAVASGRAEIRMRQLPGGDNMMGRVKFMSPNRLGIYLHDTPAKAAFALTDRRLSAGCVRVEDAPRLARWLTHKPLPAADGAANVRVDLPQPVPLYIGHFTATPAGGRIVFRDDLYNRDAALVARLGRDGAIMASVAHSRRGVRAQN